MSIKERVFKKESLDRYLAEDGKFNKTLSAKDLISMGIGAVIGTGIFILPGTVAALHSGPAITISFVIAALVCSTAAMCYAEFSSALPIAGSAYSFGNVVFGEIVGWFLGWALILEYMLSVAAVSTGFSAYFNSLLAGFGIHLPKAITGPFDPANGTFINLPAVLIVLFIAYVLSRGLRTSMTINSIVVVIKIAIIILFLLVGMFYVKPANWDPFMPFGTKGVLVGAAQVFFAYLGFDVVASSAAEVKEFSQLAQKTGIQVKEYTITSTNDIQQVSATMASNVQAIYIPNDNTVASGFQTVLKNANQNKIPIFPSTSEMTRQGGLATVSVSQYELGKMTGKMTAAILKGKDPADMAIEYPTKGTTYLNQKQAQQLGIDLPNELVTQISKKGVVIK